VAGPDPAAALAKALHELSVREATQALAAKTFTAEAYVDALLDWQRRWQVLNAYTQQDVDAVRAAARRAASIAAPIAGLPIAVKDNIDVAGYATTAGTPALRHHVPRSSAPVVQSLIDQGVVVMGKAGLHEMAAGGTCGNILFGQIRNPYDPAMVPGGSSGGSAAAVAARMVPAALGTDTAGSIRAPAAYCGCVGFKPTTGRYSRVGLVPGDVRRDTLGWFARSCADVELLDACCAPAGPAPPVALKGLRLGVPRAYFYAALEPAVAPVIDAMLARLQDAGVELVEADIPGIGDLLAQLGPMGRDLAGGLNLYIAESGAAVSAEDIVHGIADPQLRRGMEAGLAGRPSGRGRAEGRLRHLLRGPSGRRRDLPHLARGRLSGSRRPRGRRHRPGGDDPQHPARRACRAAGPVDPCGPHGRRPARGDRTRRPARRRPDAAEDRPGDRGDHAAAAAATAARLAVAPPIVAGGGAPIAVRISPTPPRRRSAAGPSRRRCRRRRGSRLPRPPRR